MLTLTCLVVGDGSVFGVEIDDQKLVSILKNVIWNKKKKFQSYDEDELTLYMAKKNGDKDGEWINDDEEDPDIKKLSNADTLQDVKNIYLKDETKMNRSLGLDDYFKGDIPKKGKIHVLVELPKRVASPTVNNEVILKLDEIRDRMDKRITSVDTKLEEMTQPKWKRYCHSEMSSKKGQQLIHELGLYIEKIKIKEPLVDDKNKIEPFSWSGLYEEQQKEEYKQYLQKHLKSVLDNEELCVYGVEKGQNVLSVAIPGFPIELIGRADLLILDDSVLTIPSELDILPRLKMVVEVKKDSAKRNSDKFQAMSELLAVDLLVRKPTMVLLTDLTNLWNFFWMGEGNTIQSLILTQPANAFKFMRKVIASETSFEAIEDSITFVGKEMRRKKLRLMLPMIKERDQLTSLRENVERYYDIESVLGPDVAMARDIGRQAALSIPMYSTMFS